MKIKDLHSLFLNSTGVSTDTRSIKSGTIFFLSWVVNFIQKYFDPVPMDLGLFFFVVDERLEQKRDN